MKKFTLRLSLYILKESLQESLDTLSLLLLSCRRTAPLIKLFRSQSQLQSTCHTQRTKCIWRRVAQHCREQGRYFSLGGWCRCSFVFQQMALNQVGRGNIRICREEYLGKFCYRERRKKRNRWRSDQENTRNGLFSIIHMVITGC